MRTTIIGFLNEIMFLKFIIILRLLKATRQFLANLSYWILPTAVVTNKTLEWTFVVELA